MSLPEYIAEALALERERMQPQVSVHIPCSKHGTLTKRVESRLCGDARMVTICLDCGLEVTDVQE